MKAAVAAFVKTPGISGVKTRLAKERGATIAEKFYGLSLACVEEMLAECSLCTAFWAVAEQEGALDPRWMRFPVVLQGEGGLGDRMHRVYAGLLNLFPAVILIGADSPQLTGRHLEQALVKLQAGAEFVFGPADDGGFYLLAGRKPIPRELFASVEYSAADTLEKLEARIATLGAVERIGSEPDVDTSDDLANVADRLSAQKERTPAQERLMVWLREQQAGVRGL